MNNPAPTIVIKCARCGNHFAPTQESIRRGTWRQCVVCNPPRDDGQDEGEGGGQNSRGNRHRGPQP